MPKNKSKSKSETGAVIRSRPAHKMRIGTRKSGKSALQMSNDALIAALYDDNVKSDHTIAWTVLNWRGITDI